MTVHKSGPARAYCEPAALPASDMPLHSGYSKNQSGIFIHVKLIIF
jgi:hypothetical protein